MPCNSDKLYYEWIVPEGNSFRLPFRGPGYWNGADQNTLSEEVTGVRSHSMHLRRSNKTCREVSREWTAEGRRVLLDEVKSHFYVSTPRRSPSPDPDGRPKPDRSEKNWKAPSSGSEEKSSTSVDEYHGTKSSQTGTTHSSLHSGKILSAGKRTVSYTHLRAHET